MLQKIRELSKNLAIYGVGDVARIAATKQSLVWQVLTRTRFGARVVDTAKASQPRSAVAGG